MHLRYFPYLVFLSIAQYEGIDERGKLLFGTAQVEFRRSNTAPLHEFPVFSVLQQFIQVSCLVA